MMRAKRIPRQTMIVGAIVVALLAAIIVLGWKYYELKKDPDNATKAEVARIITRVSTLYEVPTDEEPTVAKVQNKNQLPKQDFYKNAQNGDYVLVYANNKLAMIYREKTNKLVNVGPVNFASQDKPAIAVLNGSGSSELLDAAVQKLGEFGSQAALAENPSAAKSQIDKTIVVDVGGRSSALANSIADKLGGSVQDSLPESETAPPNASIVVIVGKK